MKCFLLILLILSSCKKEPIEDTKKVIQDTEAKKNKVLKKPNDILKSKKKEVDYAKNKHLIILF